MLYIDASAPQYYYQMRRHHSTPLLLLLLLAISTSKTTIPLQDVPPCTMTFQQFLQTYHKTYLTQAQHNYRKLIFNQNIQRLNKHNSNPHRTYNMDTNQFLDMKNKQFGKMYAGTYTSNEDTWMEAKSIVWEHSQKVDMQSGSQDEERGKGNNRRRLLFQENQDALQKTRKTIVLASNLPTPTKQQQVQSTPKGILIDWSMYAGTVRQQGYCGSCYVFAVLQSLSILNAIHKYGFHVPLSVQQVIDCAQNKLVYGCNGGFLQGALAYVHNQGVVPQQQYPYTSMQTRRKGKCRVQGGPFKVTAFDPLPSHNCAAVLNSLKLGPVAVGIAAWNLQFYKSGVFSDCNTRLDHAVAIVGYQSGRGWKIKNSWGKQWGYQGFGWIGEGNTCGICNMAVMMKA